MGLRHLRYGFLPAQRLLALARDLEPGQTVEIRYLRDGANNTVSVEVDEFEYPEVRTFGQGLGRIWGVGPDGNRWNFGLDEDFELEMAERMRHLEDVEHRLVVWRRFAERCLARTRSSGLMMRTSRSDSESSGGAAK